jgi:hypothetical protein
VSSIHLHSTAAAAAATHHSSSSATTSEPHQHQHSAISLQAGMPGIATAAAIAVCSSRAGVPQRLLQ